VHPKLNDGAKKKLQEFYLDLRRKHQNQKDYTPITLRQLESLIRLTEARAKLELREEATENDGNALQGFIKILSCTTVLSFF